jgi:hypothetical protein
VTTDSTDSPLAATDTLVRFSVSADEYELIRRRLPGLALPSAASPGSTAGPGVAALPDTELLVGLLERGILTSALPIDEIRSAADWSRTLDPVALAALVLHSTAPWHLFVQAPSPRCRATLYASSLPDASAGITIRRPRDPDTAATVEFTLHSVDRLTSEVLALLPATLASASLPPASFESTELGLSASHSIVEALQTGRPELVAAVADELHARDSVTLLRDLVAPIESSFSIVATVGDRAVAKHDWALGTRGWLKIEILLPSDVDARPVPSEGAAAPTPDFGAAPSPVSPASGSEPASVAEPAPVDALGTRETPSSPPSLPPGSLTAQMFAEEARLSLSLVDTTLIRAEILGIVSTWMRGSRG